ncbi:MAG: phage holin family protein [Novosphingobium sp.]
MEPSPVTPPDFGIADPAERSLAADMRQLAEDAKALAKAEAEYQKARAAYAGGAARSIATMAVLAGTFAFFALMALVLGAVLTLAPILSPGGATATVTGALLAMAALFGLLARSRVRKASLALLDRSDSNG